MRRDVPEKPSLEGLEEKWASRWESDGVYRFDRTKTRDQIYSIDTPPPTVSGALHPGHVCSYSHTDMLARYHRMRGEEVFYPMGWDDNGLNVERRVQIMRGITCDPSLPYDPGFRAADPPPKDPVSISRPNFLEQCDEVVVLLEQAYKQLWTTLGLSVDWSMTYETIGAKARRVSQRGFLELLDRGLAYAAEAPTLWDVDFKTAVAQAELEDRELLGAYHRLMFDDIAIETTRPELLAACVALVAHPDDERFKARFGTTVRTPLYRVEVPIVAHELADPEKGSGIAMICTFGDTTDVVWWRELGLPVRSIVGRDGRIVASPPDGVADDGTWHQIAGKTVKQAQKIVVEQLTASGELVGEPKPITHPVKFWENGTRPLEIVTSWQWFVRYPPTEDMLDRGKQLQWHPEYMRVRYENWANGLAGDWNITRQRFFGVPFPIWYPINEHGEIDRTRPLVPAGDDVLPVDPSTDVPPGYTQEQRDQPGGFAGDPDVMDTWATSSLTPQVVGGWPDDLDLYQRVYPMDLRPQAHDIIRTWLFYTVVRSHYMEDSIPFRHVAVSGFITDPDRKKLSKSKSNAADEPNRLLAEFGADGVRYWAGSARPGSDVVLDRNQMKIGRRLAIKILNASRFALSFPAGAGDIDAVTQPLDRAMLSRLAVLVDEATTAFDGYDYARALERTEAFFWSFCDDYLELVKNRAYAGGEAGASAAAALDLALSNLLRLFAPFLPYVTEEVWSWWQEGSVHRAPWPAVADISGGAGEGGDPAVLDVAAAVLGEIRKAKSEQKVSMRAAVDRVIIADRPERLALLQLAVDDIKQAGVVTTLEMAESDTPTITVELA